MCLLEKLLIAMKEYNGGEHLRGLKKERYGFTKHRKMIFLSVISVFLLLFLVLPSGFSDDITEAFLVCKSEKRPSIDGKLSSSEWDDAKPYVFRWDSSMNISGGENLMATLTMKHDDENLYILFTINDDDFEDGDALEIGSPTIRTFNSSDVDMIVLLSNGSGYEGYPVRCGSGTYSAVRPIDGEIKAGYSDGLYVFEASLNLTRYFNSTDGYVKAYFSYVDVSSEPLNNVVVPLGDSSEMYISREHYDGGENIYAALEEDTSSMNLYLPVAALIAGSGVLAVFWLRKKKE